MTCACDDACAWCVLLAGLLKVAPSRERLENYSELFSALSEGSIDGEVGGRRAGCRAEHGGRRTGAADD